MPDRQSDWQKLTDGLLEGGVLEWLSFIATILIIAAIVWSIFRIRAWYRDGVDADGSDHELMIQMLELRREGDLSEEEFRSIKQRLAVRIRSTSPTGDLHQSSSSAGQ